MRATRGISDLPNRLDKYRIWPLGSASAALQEQKGENDVLSAMANTSQLNHIFDPIGLLAHEVAAQGDKEEGKREGDSIRVCALPARGDSYERSWRDASEGARVG